MPNDSGKQITSGTLFRKEQVDDYGSKFEYSKLLKDEDRSDTEYGNKYGNTMGPATFGDKTSEGTRYVLNGKKTINSDSQMPDSKSVTQYAAIEGDSIFDHRNGKDVNFNTTFFHTT